MARDNICKACDGTGMQADDEGWQYQCTVCHGDGTRDIEDISNSARVLDVDDNNRLLD